MRRARRSRPAWDGMVIGIVVLTLLAVPTTVVGHVPTKDANQPIAGSADLAPVLAADGTFHGAPGLAGTVDADAWTLVSDLAAGEAPRFVPAGPTVASPVGPWSALGSDGHGNGALVYGTSPKVRAIAVSGTNLFVGGDFSDAATIPMADFVARWDGSAWSALGSNGSFAALNSVVFALAVSGSNLYVGGGFNDAGGIASADYLAKWNGSAWSGVGSNGAGNGAIGGFQPNVDALAVSGGDLYVGGRFADVAGIATADYLAKWDGSAWSALGTSGSGNGALNGDVYDLAVVGTGLYVGGGFTNVAGILAADNVARWNGVNWSAMGSNAGDGALNSAVVAIEPVGTDLFVGGAFINAAGLATADRVARWNGIAWSALGSNGAGDGALNYTVYALESSGNDLYVGGDFATSGIPEAHDLARWDGSSWTALGSNGNGQGALNDPVYALLISGGGLYVGGDFENAAGIATADYIAKWGLAPFTDIAGSPFLSDIVWVYQQGITSGCTPTTYCPNDPVTRAQMASFLARALHLSGSAPDAFTDDNGSIYEPNINLVAQAGVASGCSATKFCPNGLVSREQMASFMSRALHLSGPAPDAFTDDNSSIHETNINLVAREGIATGCGGTLYCPTANVTRGQMAAFLHRAFGP